MAGHFFCLSFSAELSFITTVVLVVVLSRRDAFQCGIVEFLSTSDPALPNTKTFFFWGGGSLYLSSTPD